MRRQDVYPHHDYPALFLFLLAAVVVLEVVLRAVVAIRWPSDAGAPRDERDRLIALKAAPIAFYVLVTGAFLSIASISDRERVRSALETVFQYREASPAKRK